MKKEFIFGNGNVLVGTDNNFIALYIIETTLPSNIENISYKLSQSENLEVLENFYSNHIIIDNLIEIKNLKHRLINLKLPGTIKFKGNKYNFENASYNSLEVVLNAIDSIIDNSINNFNLK